MDCSFGLFLLPLWGCKKYANDIKGIECPLKDPHQGAIPYDIGQSILSDPERSVAQFALISEDACVFTRYFVPDLYR
jgi:hypothetical protein